MIMIEWERVLKELKTITPTTQINSIMDTTIDTLYGSMYGLNFRYMTLKQALHKDFSGMKEYSISRIKHLLQRPIPNVQTTYIYESKVGFGTYGWKYDSKLIELALQKSILIDTAEGYGYGKVEQMLGEIISNNKTKHPPLLTTKVSRSHMSQYAMFSAAKRSKEKLGCPFHYQLHYPNIKSMDMQLGRVFSNLKKLGIVLSIGLGNCSVDMIESMQSYLSEHSGDVVRSVQMRYNLKDRRIEKVLIPYCQQRGINVIAYSPLGQKFSELYHPILDELGGKYKCTPAQIALAWILRKKGIVPIPRTNNLQHMKDNINASNICLSKSDIKILNKTYSL